MLWRGHASGAVRLWFGGPAIDSGAKRGAGSRLEASIDSSPASFYLKPAFALSPAAGNSSSFADVTVDSTSSCPDRPFTPIGTWSISVTGARDVPAAPEDFRRRGVVRCRPRRVGGAVSADSAHEDYFGPLLKSAPEGIAPFFAPPPLLGPLLNSPAEGMLPFTMPPEVVGPLLNSLPAGIVTLTSASGALMVPEDIEVDIDEVGIVAQAAVRAPMKESIVARLRA